MSVGSLVGEGSNNWPAELEFRIL